jgi:hypothetical protein
MFHAKVEFPSCAVSDVTGRALGLGGITNGAGLTPKAIASRSTPFAGTVLFRHQSVPATGLPAYGRLTCCNVWLAGQY